MVMPLEGSFVWHVGGDELFIDVTKVVFAGGGEPYAISHPAGGDRSLVVYPSDLLLDDLLGAAVVDFLKGRWRPHAYEIQLFERILCARCDHGVGTLAIEEALIRLLTVLVDGDVRGEPVGSRANRTLARAKTLLHTSLSEQPKLAEIARAVGVSPTYLTRLFTVAEGMPLHQYALKLKLSAALNALPENSDITCLALDLGFSSHSHLTYSFRTRFGMPPSAVRATLREHNGRSEGARNSALASQRAKRPLCGSRGGGSREGYALTFERTEHKFS